MTKRVLILCGEESGDKLGSELFHKIKHIDPKIHIQAMGGKHLEQAGAEIIFDSSEMGMPG